MSEVLLWPAKGIFHLRVCSDALVGALMQAGDYISCARTDQLAQGQFGVINTPYGVLLRFVFFEPEGYVRLEPVSHDYLTLCLHPQEVQVLGRPLLLQRDLRDQRHRGAKG